MSGEKNNSHPHENAGTAEPIMDGESEAAQSQISQQLRQLYQSVQDEGIPDKFLDLLSKLDEAEKAQSGGK